MRFGLLPSSQLTAIRNVDQLGLQKVQGEEAGKGGEEARRSCGWE